MNTTSGAPAFLAVRYWKANPWGDGGTKRSAQIDSCILESCPGGEIVEVVLPLRLGWKTALMVLLQPCNWGGLFRLRKFNVRMAVRGVRDAAIIRKQVDALGERLKAVVWEATVSAGAILACDKPILGFPQNFEALSLAGRKIMGREDVFLALTDEFNLLKKCTQVFFISKEEAFLGRNLGLRAGYLPYYPTAIVCAKLEEIRRQRQAAPAGHKFLILGSATNTPTARSIEKLLAAIKARADLSHLGFVLCGSGTEKYGLDSGSNIDVLGRVSDADLTRLLETCRAAIVFQETGSGMLTRIPELLVAGVPVIANLHAARSVEKHSGFFVAADLHGVLDLVAGSEPPVVCGLISPSVMGVDFGIYRLREYVKNLVIQRE